MVWRLGGEFVARPVIGTTITGGPFMNNVPCPAQTVPEVPSDAVIQSRFMAMYPELQSRATAIGRSINRRDPEDAAAEVIAAMWANFRQAAQRHRWLNAKQLAWAAMAYVKGGRSIAGSSTTDVCATGTALMGRATVLPLSAFTHQQTDAWRTPTTDRLQKDFDKAVSGRWRESPADRCATKLDWAAFATTLTPRRRSVLHGFARGDRPGEMAKRLEVSAGRISQVSVELQDKVLEFFSHDVPTPA